MGKLSRVYRIEAFAFRTWVVVYETRTVDQLLPRATRMQTMFPLLMLIADPMAMFPRRHPANPTLDRLVELYGAFSREVYDDLCGALRAHGWDHKQIQRAIETVQAEGTGASLPQLLDRCLELASGELPAPAVSQPVEVAPRLRLPVRSLEVAPPVRPEPAQDKARFIESLISRQRKQEV